ncbi:P-loop containing nucleoside triphosphate hydrolase protein [Phlegmacium glaucopus]|nr:P-loop containing nucleoside triphosphate hydrolase protein [Phlegmacium glaucopus]
MSSASSSSVAPNPTTPFAAQINESPLALIFNALHPLLQVFNLQSLIRFPGRSNPDASTAWSLLKILVIGLIAEVVRRNTQELLAYFSERFWITVSFNERDPCYEWVLTWLSKQPNWKTIRTASISTVMGGNAAAVHHRNIAIAPTLSSNMNSPQTIYTIPEVNKTYWVRTSHGYWVSVTRKRQEAVGSYSVSKTEYVLHLRIMTMKDADVLFDLIHEAREIHVESQGEKIRVFSPDQRVHRWKCYATCTKRPLSSVILEKSLKEKVVSDAQEFLKSRTWYTDRGIPYRRGYLFYGKPGTGKTSFVNALAGELGLEIYNISPSTSGIDDGILADLVNQIPDRALLLMEDIDAAFVDPGINRGDQQKKQNLSEKRPGLNENKTSGITLSGLLNVLDGVGAGEGRILVATTNYYDRLDEALRRPGRIDLEVKFELASKHQAREQFRQFYMPRVITETGITLTKTKSKSLNQTSDQQGKNGSAIIPLGLGEEYFKDKDLNNLDDLEFGRLADQFVEDFREYVISTASLQQYLLMYKHDPVEAVAKFKTWVEAEIDGKERKKQDEAPDLTPLAEHQVTDVVLEEKVHSSQSVQVSEKTGTET